MPQKKVLSACVVTDRRVRAALCGELELSALSRREAALFDVKIAEALRTSLEGSHYGEVLAARGLSSIALASEGCLVEFRPDGTTHPVSVSD